MIAYPDTSFLFALYRRQDNSGTAARHLAAMAEALHVSSPLLFKFRQSMRWQAFLHEKDPAKGFERATAIAALGKLQLNINSGAIVIVPVDWADVTSLAERLSAQYTWTSGPRTFDILRVATALHLGSREFLTFGANQKMPAQAEGLIVPL